MSRCFCAKSTLSCLFFSITFGVPFGPVLPVALSSALVLTSARMSVGEPRALFLAGDLSPRVSLNVPESIDEIPRITPQELKKLMDDKADIVVVDNQPKGAYDMGHVKGAVNFPWATEIDEEDLWKLPRNRLLVLYCACTHEEDAGDVAMQLMKKFGYKTIKLLQGGWMEWEKVGYPIEKAKGK